MINASSTSVGSVQVRPAVHDAVADGDQAEVFRRLPRLAPAVSNAVLQCGAVVGDRPVADPLD